MLAVSWEIGRSNVLYFYDMVQGCIRDWISGTQNAPPPPENDYGGYTGFVPVVAFPLENSLRETRASLLLHAHPHIRLAKKIPCQVCGVHVSTGPELARSPKFSVFDAWRRPATLCLRLARWCGCRGDPERYGFLCVVG